MRMLVAAILVPLMMIRGITADSERPVMRPESAPAELADVEGNSPRAGLALSTLLDEVLSRNPSLTAARLNWEAHQQRPEIASALPDPMLTYGYWFQNVETRVGAMNQRVGASQKIPFPGKRSLAAERARKEALVKMWEYQSVERDLIMRAKHAFFDLNQVEESRRIIQEEMDLLSPMINTAQVRYEGGQVAQADVLKAQLALSSVQNRLLDLIAQSEALRSRINALRDRPPNTEIGPVHLPSAAELPSREAAYAAALRYRQELQHAGAAIDRDETALALAKKQKWPDFTLGIEYTQINENIFASPPDNGQDAIMGHVSINIPIWLGKLRAQEREAEKRLAASKSVQENALNSAFAEVRELWFQAQLQQDQVRLYESTLLPQAEQSFSASMAAYESGAASFIDLLDSERALLTLRLGLVMARTELAKTLARLERAIGTDLEKVPSAFQPEQ